MAACLIVLVTRLYLPWFGIRLLRFVSVGLFGWFGCLFVGLVNRLVCICFALEFDTSALVLFM